MNFFEIIRKSNQSDIDKVESTSIYDFAAEKLKPKTFAESNKIIFSVSNFFSVSYHFISFVLAVIGGYFYSLSLNSLLYQAIFLIVCTLLLCVIELVKSSSSNTVFAQIIRKDKVTKISLIILSVTTVFSFCTSVHSAKEAAYQISTTSSFSDIDSIKNAKIDSINDLFSVQIQSIETSLKTSQNTLSTTKNKWIRIATNKDIDNSQKALKDVLQAKEKAISQITAKTQNDTVNASLKGNKIAYFIAFIIALFEVFNLCSYYYYYYYLRGCLLENNLPATPPAPAPPNDTVTTDTLKEPVQTFQTHQKLFLNEERESKKIGFQYTVKKEPNDTVKAENQNSFGIDKCENCCESYQRKTHNQRFCSTNCRVQKWEKDKGAKITFKSKK